MKTTRKVAKVAKVQNPPPPAPRRAVMQGNGVYALGKCPKCATLPHGKYCAGCAAEMADEDRLWG